MPKVSPLQSNFNGGEVSPLLYGRVDNDRYKNSLALCKNYIPTIQGGLTRRPGTMYVSPVKDSTKSTRLIPFEFSTTQAYMLEFGNQYIRFYKDNAQITLTPQNITGITQANPAVLTYAGADTYANGDKVYVSGVSGMTQINNREFTVAAVNVGANTFQLSGVDSSAYGAYTSGGTVAEIYEISSPYVEADLFQIKYTQSADVLYLVHPSYAPRKLSRTAHTSWTLTAISFLDGPYLNTNTTTTTITPSAATGVGITLTASAITGINNDTGFQTTDVGRFIRVKEGAVWGYALITAWTSTTVVTATVVNTLTNTTAKLNWRLGVWSTTTGFPGTVTFHEDRLGFGGVTTYPQRIDLSKTGDYENFAPSATDGTVASDNAIGFSLNSNTVNAVRWMTSDEKGMLVGTVGGEWNVRPSSQGEALTPTNVTAKPTTQYGSEDAQPVQVGKASLYIQRAARKLREMNYFYDVDGFRATDLTILAEHISESGFKQIAYQKEPQTIIWCVREDGILVGMTYERNSDQLNAAWHRHTFGGVSDAAGSDTIVESVAVIPSADGTREDVWFIVKRYINGSTVRHIEYMTKLFDDSTEQRDAYFVDAGLTYDAPIAVSGATRANPVVVTINSHPFSNGDNIRFADILGMEELNGNTYTVANKTANTVELTNENGVSGNVDGTAFSAYISGGKARKLVSTITGLNHLEGASISVLGDGAVQPNVTVSGGSITLSTAAATVQMGYGYNSDAQLLRLEAGAADGTALGKTRRVHRAGFLLHRTLGLKLGLNFDELNEVTFRTSSDPLTRAPSLFTGIISETLQADYDFENQICWRQSQPLPGIVLAVMPQMVLQDRG